MKRWLAALIGLVMASLGLVLSLPAAASALSAAVSYSYEGHLDSDEATAVASERRPGLAVPSQPVGPTVGFASTQVHVRRADAAVLVALGATVFGAGSVVASRIASTQYDPVTHVHVQTSTPARHHSAITPRRGPPSRHVAASVGKSDSRSTIGVAIEAGVACTDAIVVCAAAATQIVEAANEANGAGPGTSPANVGRGVASGGWCCKQGVGWWNHSALGG